MATVEQCEAQPAGLPTLANTLDLFDTYKSSQEEDKDSDEESFHLPLLDCDDDLDTSNKEECLMNELDKDVQTQIGETEDDILNKFETNGTPDIDPKTEDKILEELDEVCEKNTKEESGVTNDASQDATSKTDSLEAEVQEEPVTNGAISDSVVTKDDNDITADTKISCEDEDMLEEKQAQEEVDVKPTNASEESIESTNVPDNETKLNESEGSEKENIPQNHIDDTSSTTTSDKLTHDSKEDNENCDGNKNVTTEEDAIMDAEDVASETPENAPKLDAATEEKVVRMESTGECNSQNVDNQLLEDKNLESNKDPEQKLPDAAQETSTDEKMEPDKCENSNDSSKSQNLDCDDLLDISIIRDADEDNASAIAENANDARCGEKSDNDDQDEGSDKAENDLDETEMDQEESILTTDKEDHMDFEDGSSSNVCEQDMISGNTSDSENKDDGDVRDSENESKDSGSVAKEKTIENDSGVNSDSQTETMENGLEDTNSVSVATESQDSITDSSVKIGNKRSLTETESEVTNKKIRLSTEENVDELKAAPVDNKVKTLITFEKFMQNKKLEKKLTRSDLEQFCLQKICEAIMHKTEVGELNQTIKKQEQIIDTLRKDLQQLAKQTRDLDIVNKKLMNELKSQNGSKKLLVPLKITRSVGLQVKLNINSDNNQRRKMPCPSPRTPNATNNTIRPRTITATNAGVVRQVVASPVKVAPTTPLLSQALQNRKISPAIPVKRTPIRPKPAEQQKPGHPGVIDLTDEDDKAAKSMMGTPLKILNKTIPLTQAKMLPGKTVPKNINPNQNKTIAVGQVKTTVGGKVGTPNRTVTNIPQGVRLTPTQVKNGSIAIPASVVTSTSGTPQLMYVVQQPSSLGSLGVNSAGGGTQKAVLLNFQPTNGVLTSALNGSSVSVIPKATNPLQLKTVAAPRKHPAPLPPTPTVPSNSSLKPVLPKPHLSIRKTDTGIILQWRMPYNLDGYEGIASYQLFAYQETNATPSTDMWRKVGDVKALALPMACTLTQFADKNKYYFAVRPVDVHKRIGSFSEPEEISL